MYRRHFICFDQSNLGHLILPFDVAQCGEPAEPFRISLFVPRICDISPVFRFKCL
jgi:hypothetical protein